MKHLHKSEKKILKNLILNKKDIIQSFNPNDPGYPGKIFGLPFDVKTADLVLVPVPWEVTVSYQEGTANGPMAVLNASYQIDYYVKDVPDVWKMGVHMLEIPEQIQNKSNFYRKMAVDYLNRPDQHQQSEMMHNTQEINDACEMLNDHVMQQTMKHIDEGKMVGLVGGDHSTPLGFVTGLAKRVNDFGILQIDAHADLRTAYEGFTFSHASIMYNCLQLASVKQLVQVGIRDICEEEIDYINQHPGIVTFFDQDIQEAAFQNKSWDDLCGEIIAALPDLVYISFDIDGLQPDLCPHTGTPVPGGLSFNQAVYLIKKVARSGKTIIGFDLCEVAPGNNEWDGNVGARILYQLCTWMGVSNGKLYKL